VRFFSLIELVLDNPQRFFEQRIGRNQEDSLSA